MPGPVPPWPRPPAPSKPGPKKFWYAIAGLLVLAGIALGAAGVGLAAHAASSLPGTGTEFGSGGSTTVHLEPGIDQTVFVRTKSAAHNVYCKFRDDSGAASIKTYSGSLAIGAWQAVLTVSTEKSGDYDIHCTGDADDHFRIGKSPGKAGILGAGASIIGGGGLVLLGGITALVIAVLRRRRRLAHAEPGWGPRP